MLARVHSCGLMGLDCYPVIVETDVSNGLPMYDTVGLPDAAVKESRDRVRAALLNSGFAFPAKRIVVNLAPADTRKEGPAFDLPIAISLLAALGTFPPDVAGTQVFLGELSLDGQIRSVRGALPMVISARERGVPAVFLSAENAAEASCVEGVTLYAAGTLKDVVEHLCGKKTLEALRTRRYYEQTRSENAATDLAHVRGLDSAKRALEIAAAGGHNLLLIGAPGGGKTLLARALPGVLPDLTLDEALEVTKIQSVAGDLSPGVGLATERPFRAPHHTASTAAIVGGGQHAMPGEVSKAHNGVLFLDELPEYRREVLEALRQPLEDGSVTIARVGAQMTYPCRTMLVCAMNPCPCGFYGAPGDRCRCTQVEIRRYLSRVSGPILDRIDMHIEIESIPVETLLQPHEGGESSATMRARVNAARLTQQLRFARDEDNTARCNAHIDTHQLPLYCKLNAEARRLFSQAATHYGFSARATSRLLKVARTIADLAGCEEIAADHLAEAVQYRTLDKKYWG